MPFDFAKSYSTYSNKELVAILEANPSYQPEAILAAQNELTKRSITEEEYDALAAALKPPAIALPTPETDEPSSIFDNLEGFEDNTNALWWRNVLLIIYSIHLVALLLGYAIHEIRPFNQLWLTHTNIISLLGTPLFLALLAGSLLFWQKNKWGWYLLLFYQTATIVSILISLSFLVYYAGPTEIFFTILKLGMNAGMATLLLLPGLRRIYRITQTTAYLPIVVGVLLILIYRYTIWGGR